MILIQTKGITKSIDLFNLEIESSRGWRLVAILQDTVPVMKSEQTNTNGYMGTQLVPTGSSQTITRAIVEKDEDSAIAALTKRVEDTEGAKFQCTDEGNALAQRQIDQQHDDDQEMWNERDDLRAKRDRLKQELAAVEKRLKVLEAMPS